MKITPHGPALLAAITLAVAPHMIASPYSSPTPSLIDPVHPIAIVTTIPSIDATHVLNSLTPSPIASQPRHDSPTPSPIAPVHPIVIVTASHAPTIPSIDAPHC